MTKRGKEVECEKQSNHDCLTFHTGGEGGTDELEAAAVKNSVETGMDVIRLSQKKIRSMRTKSKRIF